MSNSDEVEQWGTWNLEAVAYINRTIYPNDVEFGHWLLSIWNMPTVSHSDTFLHQKWILPDLPRSCLHELSKPVDDHVSYTQLRAQFAIWLDTITPGNAHGVNSLL